MTQIFDHLVRPPSFCGRSGLMSLHISAPPRAGKRRRKAASFGVATAWNHPFSAYQISTAHPALQVLLKSESVWLVPGSSENLNTLLRSRGFAVTTYTLDPEEKAWIIGMLPPEKAEGWKNSPSNTTTMVVCSGTVQESTGLVAWLRDDVAGTCALGEGLKIEEVAPVRGGSIVSSLSSAVTSSLSAIYQWVAPSALKNVTIVSSTRDATGTEKADAERFLQNYEATARSVEKVEAWIKQGFKPTKAQAVQLQISKILLAQNASIASSLRKAKTGDAGSPNRDALRARVKMEHSEAFGIAGIDDTIVVTAMICLTIVASFICAANIAGKISEAYTRQAELEAQITNDLSARCADPTLPLDLRKEFCGALHERAKEGNTDWGRVAMWGGIGVASVAGVVLLGKTLTTAKPAIDVAVQRVRRRDQDRFSRAPYLQGG